jgi:hypothetical protein
VKYPVAIGETPRTCSRQRAIHTAIHAAVLILSALVADIAVAQQTQSQPRLDP